MKRILIYTHEFPPFAGGAGMHAATMARGLQRLGIAVTVLAPEYAATQSAFDAEIGIPVRRFERWEARAPWSHRALWKALVASRAQHLILLDRVALEQFAQLERPMCNYSIVVHGTEILEFFGPSRSTRDDRRMRELFRRAHWIFANSRSTESLLLAHVPEVRRRTSVGYCAVDYDRLMADAGDLEPIDLPVAGRQLVLTVGRLDVDKGHDVLLHAFADVARRHPRALLVIAGTGPLESEVRSLISHLELDNRVVMAGRVGDRQLAWLYSHAEVFVLPSRATRRVEGFGIVFLEAGLFGVPVIGGRTGGVPEAIVDGVTGFVVDATDSTALANRLEALLGDDALRRRLGRAGRERVSSEFMPERLGRDVLERVGGSRRASATALGLAAVAGYGAYFLVRTVVERVRSRYRKGTSANQNG